MDLGNIVYIIAIIAYFIYTATRKKPNPEDTDQSGSPNTPQEKSKPVSFEDLLKEIRQGQGQRERDLKESGQGKSAEPMPRRKEGRTFESPAVKPAQEVKKIKRYESYEGVVAERALPERVKLADQTRIHSHVEGIKSSFFQEFNEDQEEDNKYKKMLRNPESIKDAVILSEILKRKYF